MTLRVPSTAPSAVLHNFPPYLLSDAEDLLLCEVNTPKQVSKRTLTLIDCSTSGTKSIIVSAASANDAKWRAVAARILRLVTSRKPVATQPYPEQAPNVLLAYVRETLECGHTQDYFLVEEIEPLTAKRRVCRNCSGESAIPKKPSHSVGIQKKERAA